MNTKKLLYQTKIADNNGEYYLTHLGNGLIGTIGGYDEKIDVINLNTGEILWRVKSYERFGGVSDPIYDDKFIYLARGNDFRSIYACQSQTGICEWERNLSNSTYQFMVPLAQTETHIASCNPTAKKLTIIEKTTGKISCRAKLAHPVREYKQDVMAWNNQFVAIALDKRKKEFVLDLYDPTIEDGFVKTIGIIPDKNEPSVQIIVGDNIFIFTEKGYFYKINLQTGAVEQKEVTNNIEKPGRFCHSKVINRNEDKLYCVVLHDDIYMLCTYDLTSGIFTKKTIDVSITDVFGDNILPLTQGKGYHLSEAACLVEYDLANEGLSKTISLERAPEILDEDFLFRNTERYGENWLVAENKLIAVVEDGENSILSCWEIS